MLSDEGVRDIRRQRFLSLLVDWFIYLFTLAVIHAILKYKIKNFKEFRREAQAALKKHRGPLIWAANHLTMVDSFLIFWASVPWTSAFKDSQIPWSTPEIENYYYMGSWLKKYSIRSLMYLCRCIPIARNKSGKEGRDGRQDVSDKCAWILKEGGSVFVFPEASRARNGWFDRHNPKDFLGRLALEAPKAKFFCVYLRGEGQFYSTPTPARGESFRAYFKMLPAVVEGETTPRQISNRLFNVLGDLQDHWFEAALMLKNCSGNDLIDLKAPHALEHFEEDNEENTEWILRHLTDKEAAYWKAQPLDKRFSVFWKFFAAKEAASKALERSGISIPLGAFHSFETDLFTSKVIHRPTGAKLNIAFTDEDQDKIHCIAVFRGGAVGGDDIPGDILWSIDELPPQENPGEYVRDRALYFIAEASDDIPSPASLAVSIQNGLPVVYRSGRLLDISLSLSHSGRYVAYSFMIS